MPFTPKDAKNKTKKADTPKKQRQWQEIANSMLESGNGDADAIKAANGVIKKQSTSKDKC